MTATPTVLPPEAPQPETGLAMPMVAPLSNQGGALSAQVQATIAARYLVAMQRPRDLEVVRQRLLAECRRKGFAESAIYRKPIGGGKFVDGFSVRFAEAAARNMGNLQSDTLVIDEDDEKRVLRVTTTDIETNTSFSSDILVRKAVERRQVKDGQTVLSSRRNSEGQIVHLVAASDDEVFNKQNNLVSKAVRNNILRLLPGDIQDDCEAEINKTKAGANTDPEAAKRRVLDAFGAIGILPTQLAEFLGHPADSLTASERDELLKIHAGIKGGETNWHDVMAKKAESLAAAAAAQSTAKTPADKVREKTEGKS